LGEGNRFSAFSAFQRKIIFIVSAIFMLVFVIFQFPFNLPLIVLTLLHKEVR